MTVGLVIPVHNRSEYLYQTLRSISATRHPYVLYLLNDASTETAANDLFSFFRPESPTVIKKINPVNLGIAGGVQQGWSHLSGIGCDVFANLDADATVKPHWLDTLVQLHQRFPDRVISGFHTENHPILESGDDFCKKNTIGGINMLFGKEVLPLMEGCLVDTGWGWDWAVCDLMRELKRPFVVSRPSVVQHIGKHGMNSSHERYDVANDFEPLSAVQKRLLPQIRSSRR